MAGYRNPHYTREALRDLLTDDLPGYLTTINAEFTDGIAVSPIAKIYTAPLADYDDYPAVVLPVARTIIPDADRGDGADSIIVHAFSMQVYDYSIEVIGNWLPAEVVGERLERLVDGIWRLVLDNPTLTVSGVVYTDHCQVRDVLYSDFAPRAEGVVRGALVTLWAYQAIGD